MSAVSPDTAKTPFHLGVNYPWLNYAQDFGETSAGHVGVSLPKMSERVAQDFAAIRECGATVVRWFLLGDGRSGVVSENGIPRRPDAKLLVDIASALQIAERFELKICFSLMDYLWLQERSDQARDHANIRMLQFAAGREALLEYVLIPIFREFRGSPGLFAWEVANEPEWAIREFHRAETAKMHFADFCAFARELVATVHEFAQAPATLGSARLIWVRAWSELGLDFYQAHYYPSTEREGVAGLRKQLGAVAALDKPLWLGELPVRDRSAGYSLGNALDVCRDTRLYGAAVWRWTTPEPRGSDAEMGCIDPIALRSWWDSDDKWEIDT